MKKMGLALMCAMVAVSGPAFAERKPKPALTAEAAKALIDIKDDSLETTATFSTLTIAQKRYTWSAPEARPFLRAHINKSTGETTFQVYSVVNYAREWRFYELANYDAGEGPAQVALTKISRDVVSCRYGCTYSEHVAFELPEAQFREIANRPIDDKWRYRLKSKAGIDSDVEMEPGEFGGLIAAIDDYRAAHPKPSAKPAPKTPS